MRRMERWKKADKQKEGGMGRYSRVRLGTAAGGGISSDPNDTPLNYFKVIEKSSLFDF